MKLRTGLYTVALLAALLGRNAFAAEFSAFYVFGDSLSDIGSSPSAVASIYKLLGDHCAPGYPCPPYDSGRFSNGPVAAEYVAAALLPDGGNSSNFFDYAVGGSTTGIGNVGDGGSESKLGLFHLPGMEEQFQDYFSSLSGAANPEALYMVWGGANDLFYGGSPVTAADNIAGYVDQLALKGADTILVPNLPDLGLTPDALSQGSAVAAELEQASISFNQELANQLGALSVLFPGTDIIQFNTFAMFDSLLENPGAYGFTDATGPCLSASFQVCSNPSAYVFWDTEHPTTRADALMGAALVNSVPLPAAFWFFATGLCSLLFRRGHQWFLGAKRRFERKFRWEFVNGRYSGFRYIVQPIDGIHRRYCRLLALPF